MFQRKLLALTYHKPNNFNSSDEGEFRNLIVWLEDQKIRHYKIEDRTAIRNFQCSDWPKAFEKYLSELDCTYQATDRNAVLDWILGYAVRLEYGDEAEKLKSVKPSTFGKSSSDNVPKGLSSNPLDNLDFNDPDFKAGVTSLAMMLQVPPYQDHLEQLKAICIIVKEKLNKEAIEQANKTQDKNDHTLQLEQTDLGFDTGDYIINEAAKILRLLHIRNLRELQTQINQAIVAVQMITANPKTDSRLGKIGRS